MVTARALHYVFKIPNRKLTVQFYREILGMKVLRHEEFSDGCDAACNGPYNNRWSKTMIGYGPEDSRFVIELTYNYGIDSYEIGNDFQGITIQSRGIIERAKKLYWPINQDDGKFVLEAPGGYKYFIIDNDPEDGKDPVQKVSLSCSNLKASIAYWKDILGMSIYEEGEKNVILGYGKDQVKLQLEEIEMEINRGKAYGRTAFAVPYAELPLIQQKIKETSNTIVTDLITLDTPGKASVCVIILADPDGHEICFVDEEGFSKLSVPDYPSEAILDRFIAKEDV